MPTQNPLKSTYQGPILKQWIDYNGHMSEAYYVLIFGFATDELYQRLGLGDSYRRQHNCSIYTIEAHINYLQEVGEAEIVHVDTQLLEVGDKKLRFCHTMKHSQNGKMLAFSELFVLFVDTKQGGSRVFSTDIKANISQVIQNQGLAEAPALLQRRVGQPFR